MANVRGRSLIDAVAFVGDSFGHGGVQAVLAKLDDASRRTFGHRIRETGWYPIDAFVAYLSAAKGVLAPSDDGFFRRQGRYTCVRQKPLLARMLSTHDIRMRMLPTVWRLYYDVGSLEVVESASAAEATCRILDFPARPELCERFCGVWEGVLETPQQTATAVETACRLRGASHCEFHVSAS